MTLGKNEYDKDCARGVCVLFAIAFLAISFLFFVIPCLTFWFELPYFAQQPFFVPIILGVLSFIFGLALLYTQHRIGRDKSEPIEEVVREMIKRDFSSGGGPGQVRNPDQSGHGFKYYDTAVKLLENEVTFNWQRISCFLVTNSIMFAAWAIIFAEIEKAPRILLVGIALLGCLLSVVWISASIRGNKFHFFWLEKLRKFEEDNIPEKQTLFLPLEKLTKGEKIKVRKKEIELKGLAKLGVGGFFVFLSYVFLGIYLLITVYSLFIPSLPLIFRDL